MSGGGMIHKHRHLETAEPEGARISRYISPYGNEIQFFLDPMNTHFIYE